MKTLIASDHAGFALKEKIKQKIKREWMDLGPSNEERVDYPDFADSLAKKLKPNQMGVLICGSGQGMCIRANKYSRVRAALCWSKESAELARQHNDANVLCLGARLLSEEILFEILESFFSSQFEGGRHADRVKKLSASTVKSKKTIRKKKIKKKK